MSLEDLKAKAEEYFPRAYCHYSGFKVASAVRMKGGQVFGGCNIENASYGGTVCAERVAIWKGVSEGQTKIEELLVLTDSKDPWPPCGFCRQVIFEFSDPTTKIHAMNLQGEVRTQTVSELCPDFFGPDQLA